MQIDYYIPNNEDDSKGKYTLDMTVCGKNGKEKKPKKMSILIAAKQNKSGLRAAKRVAKELQKFADVQFDKSTAQRRIRWRIADRPVVALIIRRSRFDRHLIISNS